MRRAVLSLFGLIAFALGGCSGLQPPAHGVETVQTAPVAYPDKGGQQWQTTPRGTMFITPPPTNPKRSF